MAVIFIILVGYRLKHEQPPVCSFNCTEQYLHPSYPKVPESIWKSTPPRNPHSLTLLHPTVLHPVPNQNPKKYHWVISKFETNAHLTTYSLTVRWIKCKRSCSQVNPNRSWLCFARLPGNRFNHQINVKKYGTEFVYRA